MGHNVRTIHILLASLSLALSFALTSGSSPAQAQALEIGPGGVRIIPGQEP